MVALGGSMHGLGFGSRGAADRTGGQEVTIWAGRRGGNINGLTESLVDMRDDADRELRTAFLIWARLLWIRSEVAKKALLTRISHRDSRIA